MLIEYKGDMFKKIPDDQPGYKDWAGRESHYLTVIDSYMRITEGKSRQRYFLCKCKCGNEKLVHGDGIRKQRIKSCGCWKSKVDARKAKNMGLKNLKHGLSESRIYKIWDSMLYRCNNPNDASYENYGGRGITVCEKWHTFDGFYEDMAEGYADNLTIDRKDVNGNYEKGNCRWITRQEQAGNKTNTIYIEHKGRRMKLKDWALELGLKESTIKNRLRLKMPTAEVLFPGLKHNSVLITYKGETKTPKEWSAEVDIPEKTIKRRYFRNWSPEKILTQPVRNK